ncbi:hypothetical protein [Qipengyuania huizhouensis]|uniref:hypothetical protein n=1 Tax=Qipengyuania huizhouensis TaxID=2867245 RepID=UPI001C875B29|nr:hypothetical protein [Qipengyuania huizhouensis]MBX7460713.1 hypothetical protein [Qipengyuania huizhouensis]
MVRYGCFPFVLCLAACNPPASEDYASRPSVVEERTAPAEPIDSPDTEGAAWAMSATSGRLLYGKPGHAPLLSLACEDGTLVYTRYVAADPNAKAVLALIGNGHVERLWIDAEEDEQRWLWRGRLAADDPRLEVLTGPRRVEATVPGAGSVTLNASRAPGEFITSCAAELTPPPVPPEDPA